MPDSTLRTVRIITEESCYHFLDRFSIDWAGCPAIVQTTVDRAWRDLWPPITLVAVTIRFAGDDPWFTVVFTGKLAGVHYERAVPRPLYLLYSRFATTAVELIAEPFNAPPTRLRIGFPMD